MKRKFMAWLSRLRWKLVHRLGGERPGSRVLVAQPNGPGVSKVEVNYRFMVYRMADLLDERHAGIVREAVWHRLVREMDAAGLLQYELYRTGENTVTVVCSLQGLSAPAMEKRLACMRTGASDRVLEQVAERWNGLEERRGAVRHLQMSESEIVSSYRTARDPKRQIGILAELNAVTPREIREVLEEAGALMLKPRSHGGGRPLSFDAAAARQMFEAGLTDEEMARKLGVPEKRLAEWRRRQGLMRPKYNRARAAAEAEKTTAPEQTLEQKEESMAVMTTSTSAPAEKANKVVTVETLFDLLRSAVDAGYGEAPVTVERCRFTEMRLRVELLMTGGLRVGGEPVAVELEGVPEAPAGKEA